MNCEVFFSGGVYYTVHRKTAFLPPDGGRISADHQGTASAHAQALQPEPSPSRESGWGCPFDMAGVGIFDANGFAGRGTARRRRGRGANRTRCGFGLAYWRRGAQAAIKGKESQIVLAFQLFMAYTGIG